MTCHASLSNSSPAALFSSEGQSNLFPLNAFITNNRIGSYHAGSRTHRPYKVDWEAVIFSPTAPYKSGNLLAAWQR